MSTAENPYAMNRRPKKPVVCKVCDQGVLLEGKVQPYGSAAGCLGLFLALPGSLVIAAMGLLWVLSVLEMRSIDGTDPVFDGFLLGGLMLPIALVALIPTMMGLFLMRSKSVLRCSNCGAVTQLS